jgi:hypothetical protein
VKALKEKDQAISQLKDKIRNLEESKGKLEQTKSTPKKQFKDGTKAASQDPIFVKHFFRLPKWSMSRLNDKDTKDERDIAKEWGLDPNKSYKLALLGPDRILEPSSGESQGSMLIRRKGDKEPFASFMVNHGKLQFSWSPQEGEEPKRAQHLLRECILEISEPAKKTNIALRNPTTIDDKERDFNFNKKLQFDFLKDEIQGRPSRDFYFDAVELQIGDKIFPGLAKDGRFSHACFVPIYREFDHEWIRFGLIEKLHPRNDKNDKEKKDVLLTFSLPNMPQRDIPKVTIRSLRSYMEIDGQFVEVARIDKPK